MSNETTQLGLIEATLTKALVVWQEERDALNQLLDAVRGIDASLAAIASVNSPTGFRVTEQALPLTRKGDTTMAPIVKAGADLQILDDGKGVLFTLTPVNKAGATEPLPAGTTVTGTSSAPASLLAPVPDPGDPTATPPRPPDTTGLVFLSTVPQPPVDATGIVVTFTAPFGSTAAAPIDVTADNSPVGFTITETAE